MKTQDSKEILLNVETNRTFCIFGALPIRRERNATNRESSTARYTDAPAGSATTYTPLECTRYADAPAGPATAYTPHECKRYTDAPAGPATAVTQVI